MWSESSSVSTVNLAKKIYYHSREIEFFLGVPFWRAMYLIHSYHSAHAIQTVCGPGDLRPSAVAE